MTSFFLFSGTMPFGNLMQLPLQHSPDQLGETYQVSV